MKTLELQNIKKSFKKKEILHGIDLQIRSSEVFGLLGPNGAGKSSLVKLIDRSLHPIVKPQSHLKLFGSHRIKVQNLRRRIGLVTTDLESRLKIFIYKPFELLD